VLGTVSVAVLLVALFAVLFPSVVGWLVAIAAGWMGLTTGARAFLQARRARSEERGAAQHATTLEGAGHDE
jgi:hypothetical protein